MIDLDNGKPMPRPFADLHFGSAEPVESVPVRVKRSVVVEMHETLGRLLARSTGFKPNIRR